MQAELLSVKEACGVLNCGPTKLYEILNDGKLKAVKLDRKTLIPKSEITAFIDSLDSYEAKDSQEHSSKREVCRG